MIHTAPQTDLWQTQLPMPRQKCARGRKEKKHETLWSKNPESTEALVATPVDDEAIRNGLFHDPKGPQNPSGHPKDYWHMRLAEGVFGDLIESCKDDEDLRKNYITSIGNYLGYLKSVYKAKVGRLKGTGGMFKLIALLEMH